MSERAETGGAGGVLTGSEAAVLSQQIAGLTRAGLPLVAGLHALAEELPRGRLRRSMRELAGTVEAGAPLEQAVEDHQAGIPPHLRGLVKAGIRSRCLGELLARYCEYAGVGTELKRALLLSLAYPVLTAGIALVFFLFVCVVVVYQFEALYRDFQTLLPRATVALLALAHGVRSIWTAVPVVAIAGFCIWLAVRVFLPRPERRSLAGRLPLVGPVWRSTALAEFCHLLALLLESDLPLPEALRLSGEAVQDADLDASCRAMARSVESGRLLSHAMAEQPAFPLGLARLVRWAENRKSLPDVLHVAGSMFATHARSYSTFSGTVFTFVCVLIVFFMVMVIPILFLPLFQLISRLSG
jgi:type II secretory pathway component PulF